MSRATEFCSQCGEPATRWLNTVPYCQQHMNEAMDSEIRAQRLQRISELEAERDELRAEVERLKKEQLATKRENVILADECMNRHETCNTTIDELKQQLAAARDGSLQAWFDAVLRSISHDDYTLILVAETLSDALSCADTPKEERDVLVEFARRNQLSTAVLDELWGEE